MGRQLWHTGSVAPRHVGSSWIRDWTCVPCIGRRILYHGATREAPHCFLNIPGTILPQDLCTGCALSPEWPLPDLCMSDSFSSNPGSLRLTRPLLTVRTLATWPLRDTATALHPEKSCSEWNNSYFIKLLCVCVWILPHPCSGAQTQSWGKREKHFSGWQSWEQWYTMLIDNYRTVLGYHILLCAGQVAKSFVCDILLNLERWV